MAARLVRRAGPGGLAVVAKEWPGAPAGFFESEACGLRWLAQSATVLVPEVLSWDATSIELAYVAPGAPSTEGAAELGRRLADLHAAGAPGFGAPWPGFIGPLPMENRPAAAGGWPSFYAERRVLPFLRQAVDGGALGAGEAAVVEAALSRLPDLAGADEPPSRLHGDLWSGNLVWDGRGRAWVIDPAAHGGHRETDLAMLALFGTPGLTRLLAAYDEHRPLAAGWRERVGLHQLHPLLVHAVLFGGGYGAQAVAAARPFAP